jgi:type II secretory pathway predicted ATPase ExeA
MFLDYYGFRENPFGVVADTRFLYLSPSHYNALNALYHGLNNGQEFLALVAQPGIGKTTVLRRLAPQLGVRVVFLSLTNSGTRELIGCLLASFGVDPGDNDLLWMHERLNDLLRNEARSSHRFVLILDEAQNLTSSTLETLRLLSNFETPSEKLIQTVLVGQPSLAEALSRPEHELLRQRLSVIARLEPLPPEEVSKYIEFRLRVAGYAGPLLFNSGACKAIAAWSNGIPRRINTLCFNALSYGQTAAKHQIDVNIVRAAIAVLDLNALTPEAQAGQPSAISGSSKRAPWLAVAVPMALSFALVVSFLYLGKLNRWISSSATTTLAKSDVAQPVTVSSTSTAPESNDPTRTGRDFGELPEVVVSTTVSDDEPAKNTGSSPTPAKANLASVESSANPLKESVKALGVTSSAPDTVITVSHSDDQEKISSDVKQGDRLMRRGRYDQALGHFQAALALDPTSRSLRAKIEAVRRAKATEARVLQ